MGGLTVPGLTLYVCVELGLVHPGKGREQRHGQAGWEKAESEGSY